MMERKLKHLDYIQQIVGRMAHNSFLIKGWSITLVFALFALAAKDTNDKYVIIAYSAVFVFWILDGYYLSQERLFRALYNNVRLKGEGEIDFSMDTSPFTKNNSVCWISAIFSKTLVFFYFFFMAIMLVVMFFFKK